MRSQVHPPYLPLTSGYSEQKMSWLWTCPQAILGSLYGHREAQNYIIYTMKGKLGTQRIDGRQYNNNRRLHKYWNRRSQGLNSTDGRCRICMLTIWAKVLLQTIKLTRKRG